MNKFIPVVGLFLAGLTFVNVSKPAQAITAPELDFAYFGCKPTNTSVIEMGLSFTENTVEEFAYVNIYRSGIKEPVVQGLQLPEPHVITVLEIPGHVTGSTYRVEYNYKFNTHVDVGTFTPQNCPNFTLKK